MNDVTAKYNAAHEVLIIVNDDTRVAISKEQALALIAQIAVVLQNLSGCER